MADINFKDLFSGDIDKNLKAFITDMEKLVGLFDKLTGENKVRIEGISDSIKKINPTVKNATAELSKFEKEILDITNANKSYKKSQENIEKATKEAVTQTQSLAKATATAKREVEAATKTYGANSKQVQAATKTYVEAKTAQDRFNQTLRQAVKDANATTGSYNELTARNAKLSRILKDVPLDVQKTSKAFQMLKKEFSDNTAKLKQFDAELGQNFRNVGNYKSAFQGVVTTLKQTALAYVGVTAAIRALSNISKIIIDFEQAQANLAAVTGKTVEEISDLTNEAKRLGATTAFSASQVSSLQTELAKLGFTGQEILNLGEPILDLAAALGSDLAETATVAGATLRGFGLEASEAQRVIDVIAKSASSSALDLGKFSTAISAVAPVAKNAGLSLEQTTSAIGVLIDRGFDASTAGTALRNILLEAGKEGLTFKQALDQVNNAADTTQEALRLFGTRGAAVATTLAQNQDAIAGLEEKLNSAAGAAKSAADKQLNTLNGRLKILNSAFEGFVLALEDGEGVIGKLAKSIIELATSILEFLTPAQESEELTKNLTAEAGLFSGVLEILTDYFVEIVAAIGLYKVGVIASNKATKLFNLELSVSEKRILAQSRGFSLASKASSVFTIGVGRARTALTGLSRVVASNPLGLLLAALPFLIEGFNKLKDVAFAGQNVIDKYNVSTEELTANVKKNNVETFKQQDALKSLLPILESNTISEEKKRDAINELNAQYPELLKNIDLEKASINDVTEAIKNQITELEKQIELKISKESFEQSVRNTQALLADLQKFDEDRVAIFENSRLGKVLALENDLTVKEFKKLNGNIEPLLEQRKQAIIDSLTVDSVDPFTDDIIPALSLEDATLQAELFISSARNGLKEIIDLAKEGKSQTVGGSIVPINELDAIVKSLIANRRTIIQEGRKIAQEVPENIGTGNAIKSTTKQIINEFSELEKTLKQEIDNTITNAQRASNLLQKEAQKRIDAVKQLLFNGVIDQKEANDRINTINEEAERQATELELRKQIQLANIRNDFSDLAIDELEMLNKMLLEAERKGQDAIATQLKKDISELEGIVRTELQRLEDEELIFNIRAKLDFSTLGSGLVNTIDRDEANRIAIQFRADLQDAFGRNEALELSGLAPDFDQQELDNLAQGFEAIQEQFKNGEISALQYKNALLELQGGLVNANNTFEPSQIQFLNDIRDFKIAAADIGKAFEDGLLTAEEKIKGLANQISDLAGDFFRTDLGGALLSGFEQRINQAGERVAILQEDFKNATTEEERRDIAEDIRKNQRLANSEYLAAVIGAFNNSIQQGNNVVTALKEAGTAVGVKALTNFIAGFETGGYTGDYGTKEVAGVVHGKEMVLSAPITRGYGLKGMSDTEAINRIKEVHYSEFSNNMEKGVNDSRDVIVQQSAPMDLDALADRFASKIPSSNIDYVLGNHIKVTKQTGSNKISVILKNNRTIL